jgi:hypothetical protein
MRIKHLLHLGCCMPITGRVGLRDPHSQHRDGRWYLSRVDKRLGELLVRGHLIVRAVADQSQEPLAPFLHITLAQTLNRQSVSKKGIGGILSEALFQH